MNIFSAQELEHWMSFYYENPQPDLIPIFIKSLSKEGFLTKENTQEPIICFLSLVFRDNSEKIRDWLSEILDNLAENEQELIIKALFLANTLETKNYLCDLANHRNSDFQELINYLLNTIPPNIEEIPLDNPAMIDILWSAFMATGKEEYVIKIISCLSESSADHDSFETMMSQMAQWSLTSYLKKHEKVRLICQDQLKFQPESIASIIEKLINKD